jgi:predicted lipoprotein with Yx(FWY)xxD motif
MRLRVVSCLVGLAVVAALGIYWSFRPQGTDLAMRDAPLVTPPGITLRSTARGGRANGTGAATAMLFADSSGATLYSFDKGSEPGAPGCAEDCAKSWSPALAPANAAAAGDWSVVARPDRTSQWAYKGQPLYVRASDAPALSGKRDGAGEVWHTLPFEPQAGPGLPLGIGLRDLPNGGGEALVDDKGMTLYEFDGAADGCAPACARHWKPASAPEIARRIGDFSVVARKDGIRQWAHQDRPLYRFDGDLQPDDANGSGFDTHFHTALLRRYFLPDAVAVRHAPALGDILMTRDGMTLYARDRFIDADGHNFRTDHGAEATGRALGVMSCDVECAKTWRPLAAPAGALPSGFWDIFARPDGSRQWAYKGYALYTFAGDHQPGEINGNESYTLMPLGQDDPYAAALAGAATSTGTGGGGASRPGIGVGAMFWRAATP